MGILSRFWEVGKSNVHALLDKAEDPTKMINQVIRDAEDDYARARSAVAEAIAQEKLLKKKLNEAQEGSIEWEKKAGLALQKGDEDLARKALMRKQEYDKQIASLSPQLETATQNSAKLKETLSSLQQRIESAKRRRGTLVARQKAAEAQKKVQRTLSSISSSSNAFSKMDRMEEKITAMEAESEALTELEVEGSSLDREFADLETTSVDDELSALKQKMGKTEVDDELEALKKKVQG